MNEKNVEYLLDQVKYAGLGDGHGNEIRENIAQLPKDFKIMHDTKFGEDAVAVSLNFVKSEKSDLYFFNNYDVTLKPAGSPDVTIEQQFRISNKGQSISLMEAYNMMNNRAVHKQLTNKEGKPYKAWMMLDYKNTDQNGSYKMKFFFEKYGYNLDKALSRFPIQEIREEPGKTNIIQSLEKGNLQKVTFEINGKEHQLSIEANPNTRGINIYNGNNQRIEYGQLVSEAKAQNAKTAVHKDNTQAQDEGSAKQTKKRGHSVA